jgi:hypothetical protein
MYSPCAHGHTSSYKSFLSTKISRNQFISHTHTSRSKPMDYSEVHEKLEEVKNRLNELQRSTDNIPEAKIDFLSFRFPSLRG